MNKLCFLLLLSSILMALGGWALWAGTMFPPLPAWVRAGIPPFFPGRADAGSVLLVEVRSTAKAQPCPPTEPDALGPMYKPQAPLRDSVGKGYVLRGVVKASGDCAPITGARIEFWLTGPDGRYDDDHRAAVISQQSGAYRFESNFPVSYASRPPHIHVRVTAPGYRTLVTQHYPEAATNQANLDLALVAE